MLIDLLGYFVLGLSLALPLKKLLLWLAAHYGLYTPPWNYLRPYMPGDADYPAPDQGQASAGSA